MENAVITTHNPTNQPITKAVIWLHGLGADGHDFLPIVPALGLDEHLAVRFIFPHAPQMPVTINGGYVMSSWYDILAMGDLMREVDVPQIQLASARIKAIVEAQVAQGLTPSDIVVAGFSQGGAVAYHTALTLPDLGGLLALSTYFATAQTLHIDQVYAKRDLPIYIQHGTYDDKVSPNFATQAEHALQVMGFAPKMAFYPAAHHLHDKQISDIGQWFNEIFSWTL